MSDCRVLELNNTRALLSVPPGTPGGPASGLEVDIVTTVP